MLEKAHPDANELVCTHRDRGQQRYVKGLHFVSLLCQADELAGPIAAELVRETVPVSNARPPQTTPQSPSARNEHRPRVADRCLLAARWSASAENMNLARALGHHFELAPESRRPVAPSEAERAQGRFQAVHPLGFPGSHPLRGCLRAGQEALPVTRQVVTSQDGSQGVLRPVGRDTDLNQTQLSAIYQRRWKVEGCHKPLQQNASMGGVPPTHPPGQPLPDRGAGLHQTRSAQP